MIDLRAILLVFACLLFGVLIAAENDVDPAEDSPIIAASPRPAASPAAPLPSPARREDLLAVSLARPLFSHTRRPPETAQEDAGANLDLADKRLAGIVIEPDRRFAIFAVTGGKPVTLSEGESVNGWRIDAITPTEISLTSPSGTKSLQPTLDPNRVIPERPAQRAHAPAQPQPQTGQPVPSAAPRPAAPTTTRALPARRSPLPAGTQANNPVNAPAIQAAPRVAPAAPAAPLRAGQPRGSRDRDSAVRGFASF
jgi:hypothetical protein